LGLSEKDKEQLKEMAKKAIESVLYGQSGAAFKPSENLKEKGGAFVTIKKKGDLRGCIGYIRAVLPIHQTVKEAAIQAAFHDPRFAPVNKNEWKDIEMEISVLTPMRKIKDVEEIEVGKHGLYIEKGYDSGLLLPQVATEYNWDRMTFLEHTCYKAGLQRDAWKSKDINIYVFSADIF
jgi:AmmeMemoRadiSam system protein A